MDALNLASTADRDSLFSAEIPAAAADEDFFSRWLSIQCKIIPEVRCGLILFGPAETGPYVPVATWPDAPGTGGHLMAAADRTIQERAPLLIQRPSRNFSDGPAESYDAAYPIEVNGQLYGALVLEISPRPRAQLEAVLQQLSWGSVWFELRVYREKAAADTARTGRLQSIVDLLATTLEHKRFNAAATALVTDLALRFSCERVSLGVVQGGRVHLNAVSHSLRFSKRVSLTRSIEAAMDEAFDRADTVIHPAPSDAKQVLAPAHVELARRHAVSTLCSVPLTGTDKTFGVLTFERVVDRPFDTAEVHLYEAVGTVLGPVLDLKYREDQPIRHRIRDAARTQIAALTGTERMAPKFTVAVLAVAVTVLALTKIDYRVSAKTIIEAETLRAAVAPFNGYIAESRVRAGDVVRANDVLFTLDDRDLKLEAAKWRSQKEQYVKQYHLAMAEHNAAQIKIISAQIAQADAELALVEDQLARTRVRAPIRGVITKGDLSQSIGAPVERGQVLFESAPLDSYRLVLQIDERDIGEIRTGMRGRVVLSAFAGSALPFAIQNVTPVSEARDGRNYFRVEAKLDRTPDQLRPGMEGVGKVEIGRSHLIWAWTHGMIDSLRLFIWSWWP